MNEVDRDALVHRSCVYMCFGRRQRNWRGECDRDERRQHPHRLQWGMEPNGLVMGMCASDDVHMPSDGRTSSGALRNGKWVRVVWLVH